MAYKKIRLLYAEGDRAALEPILAQLNARGVKFPEKGGQIVLAVLSGNLYADPEKTEALLGQLSAGGQNILPLQLDKAPIPDVIMNALFASNIIPTADREPEQIAQRIIDALPAAKNPLPKFFIAGALVLAAFIGLFLWRGQAEDAPEAPTEPQMVIPAGLTEDELVNVKCVVIMGSQFTYYTEDDGTWEGKLWELASLSIDESEIRWYSHEDGSEVQLQEYDLSFLSAMPNLEELHMAKVKVTAAPDLSGLESFRDATVVESEMEDVRWLANSRIRSIWMRCDVDVSPFSDSPLLENIVLEVINQRRADFSDFSPPNLKEISLTFNDVSIVPDLSGLSDCTQLCAVQLLGGQFPDLNFLQNAGNIRRLDIRSNYELWDISAFGNLKLLQDLTIDDCTAIADFSPIGGCESLERIVLGGDINRWTASLQDVSFLAQLPRLKNITLYNANLQNLNFLNALSQHRQTLDSLSINGTVADWAGLGAMKEYGYLDLDINQTPVDNILPHLAQTRVAEMVLRNFTGENLAPLPEITGSLELDNSSIRDLTTLPGDWTVPALRLRNCQLLSSLEGLQADQLDSLYVYNGLRLSDWSALAGMNLKELTLIGGYSLPDFGTFRVQNLRLDSVSGVEDLTFLDSMDAGQEYSFTLVGLENVNNLQPLARLHGNYLAVPPQLAEQAEDLVKEGNFREVRIEYPVGGWELDNGEISLLSLEELETLPKALLRRVSSLAIVGDMLVDLSKMQVSEYPGKNGAPPQLMVIDRQTREKITVDASGGVISDLSQLQNLTGLRQLQLWGQPLENLEGIHNFLDLMGLTVEHCPNLTDASHAFTMQNLQMLSLRYCPVESIQGVQNLRGLWQLDISCTEVTDLAPLAKSDFSQGIAQMGGVTLILDSIQTGDFSALASIDGFALLSVNSQNADLWLEYLEGKQVSKLCASYSFEQMEAGTDINAAFAEFVRSHPELTELQLSGNNRLTDVSVLLELPNLQSVRLSRTMEGAIASLGEGYSFRLNIS